MVTGQLVETDQAQELRDPHDATDGLTVHELSWPKEEEGEEGQASFLVRLTRMTKVMGRCPPESFVTHIW